MPRTVLGLSALVFIGFGLAFLLLPDRMVSLVGLTSMGHDLRADVRAVHGGLEIGVGVLALIWLRAGAIQSGLQLCGAGLVGLAVGRIVGIALASADVGAITWALLAAELVGAITCLVFVKNA